MFRNITFIILSKKGLRFYRVNNVGKLATLIKLLPIFLNPAWSSRRRSRDRQKRSLANEMSFSQENVKHLHKHWERVQPKPDMETSSSAPTAKLLISHSRAYAEGEPLPWEVREKSVYR